jgi:hypothetical protein
MATWGMTMRPHDDSEQDPRLEQLRRESEAKTLAEQLEKKSEREES